MEDEGVTLHRAAEQLMVCHSLFVRWQQQQDKDGDPILAMLKRKWNANYPGPIGQLKHLEQALLRHVFEKREQGLNVHTFDLVIKASSLSPEFNVKHFVARCSAVKRFLHAHPLVYRMGTHETQRKPEDVAQEASEYINLMRPFLEGPHSDRRFILNMDQTPVFFSMTAKRTLGGRCKNRTHSYINERHEVCDGGSNDCRRWYVPKGGGAKRRLIMGK